MDSNVNAALVSIIMPVYNSALYIRQAIDSIVNQSYSEWELICIDDGSVDDSVAIVRSFDDPRIRLVVLDKNGGVAAARNKGLSLANGSWIAFLDSDDIAHRERLERQVRYMLQHPEAAAVFTRVRLVDVYGNPHGSWPDDEKTLSSADIHRLLPYRNCLAQPSAMIRADVLGKFAYRVEYHDSEDWALWLELTAAGHTLHKLDETLVDYRIRPSSETARSNASPFKKLIRFRSTYIRIAGKNNPLDPHIPILRSERRKERASLLLDTVLRQPVRLAIKLFRANPIALCFQLLRLTLFLRKHTTSHYFFFPFHHIGGAEKVHLAVVNETIDKPVVLFTKKSDAFGYKAEFEEKAHCLDIWRLCWNPVFKTLAAAIILRHINRLKNKTAIGANSQFYYEMLALQKTANDSNRWGDLVHAFVHPEERGSEHWALPVVGRLHFRIIIGERTRIDLQQQYEKNRIPSELLDRIFLIHNYVSPIDSRLPNEHSAPKIIYIGRGTPEKRVHLIGQIAQALQEYFPGLTIQALGDVQRGMPQEYYRYLVFCGVIPREEEVYRNLNNSDFLLLTSQREGMPMAVAEAMMCGTIPLACAVGNIPFILRDGHNGWLLPADDDALIVQKATSIIVDCWNNKALFNDIRLHATKDAIEHFSYATFHQRWQELLYPSRA